MIDWEENDATFIENSFWVETVALHCIFTALEKIIRNPYMQSKILELLDKCGFGNDLMGKAFFFIFIKIINFTTIFPHFSGIFKFPIPRPIHANSPRCQHHFQLFGL